MADVKIVQCEPQHLRIGVITRQIIQKDMRIRLPKAAAVNLGLESGKTVLEVFVGKNNNEIVLKVSDKKEEEESV